MTQEDFFENHVKHFKRRLFAATTTSEQDQLCKSWLGEIESQHEEPFISMAFEIVECHKARIGNGINIERVDNMDMSRKDDHSTNVGGNQIASASGHGTRVDIQNSEVFKNVVDSSSQINDALKPNLLAARDEVVTLDLEPGLKEIVLQNFAQLTEELDKAEPRKGVLQYIWDGLSKFMDKAPSLIKLGSTLASLFGINVPKG